MSAKKIPTAHKGRKCQYPLCGQPLSIYNLQINCHMHLNQMSGKARWDSCEDVLKKGTSL